MQGFKKIVRSCSWTRALFIAGVILLCLWRGSPVYRTHALHAECGTWTRLVMEEGVSGLTRQARPDYCVLLNAVILRVSTWVAEVGAFGGWARLPEIMNVVTSLATALLLVLWGWWLRRLCGWAAAVAGTLALLVVPQMRTDMYVWGDAANFGFFCGPVTAVGCLYALLEPVRTRRGAAALLAVAALTVLTSPMAGALVAGTAMLGGLKELAVRRAEPGPAARRLLAAGPWLLVAALEGFYLYMAHARGPSAHREDWSAWRAEAWLEVLLGRQWLYVWIAPVLHLMNNEAAVLLSVMSLGAAVFLIVALSRSGEACQRRCGQAAAWLLASGWAMALVTFYTRSAVLNNQDPGWWQAGASRYDVPQAMLFAGAWAILLTGAARRWPQTGGLLAAGGALVALSLVLFQTAEHRHVAAARASAGQALPWPVQADFALRAATMAGRRTDGGLLPVQIDSPALAPRLPAAAVQAAALAAPTSWQEGRLVSGAAPVSAKGKDGVAVIRASLIAGPDGWLVITEAAVSVEGKRISGRVLAEVYAEQWPPGAAARIHSFTLPFVPDRGGPLVTQLRLCVTIPGRRSHAEVSRLVATANVRWQVVRSVAQLGITHLFPAELAAPDGTLPATALPGEVPLPPATGAVTEPRVFTASPEPGGSGGSEFYEFTVSVAALEGVVFPACLEDFVAVVGTQRGRAPARLLVEFTGGSGEHASVWLSAPRQRDMPPHVFAAPGLHHHVAAPAFPVKTVLVRAHAEGRSRRWRLHSLTCGGKRLQ